MEGIVVMLEEEVFVWKEKDGTVVMLLGRDKVLLEELKRDMRFLMEAVWDVVVNMVVVSDWIGISGQSSSITSNIDSSKYVISEALRLGLVAIGGREGVPSQRAPLWCLWQEVWKTDLQAKHFTGLAGFLRGFLQWAQELMGSETAWVGDLAMALSRTALLKLEISWPRSLLSLMKRSSSRFLTNQRAATWELFMMADPWTCTSRLV